MKSEKGITLTSLVIYIMVATIAIATMAIVSSFFFSNINLVRDQDKYAVEFNKFNMFFVNDVKNNKTAQVQTHKITFEDGTIYEYRAEDKSVYRNGTKVAELVQELTFTADTYQVENTSTVKNLIRVSMNIGKRENFQKEIEYVLKYW